jgi:UDP-glucose 4-epimerase
MFNVYGPRQSLTNPYQGVASIFIGNILRREPVLIYGDGEQTRDFVYISDVVKAWLLAAVNPRAVGKVFNLGCGKSISINRLVAADIKGFGFDPSKYPVKHLKVRPGDQRHMRADISLTKKTLGWSPKMPFEKGMAQVIEWARQSRSTGKKRR